MPGGLSLWLVPDEPARGRLAALMEELAARLRTPVFAPHLTLLGRVTRRDDDAVQAAHALAAGMRPVLLRLTRAAEESAYFRCVFLEAEPSPELLGAHQKARRAFGGGPDRWRPHLSLVYGRLAEGARHALAEEAARKLELPFALTAGRIELHETTGLPRAWRLRASYALATA